MHLGLDIGYSSLKISFAAPGSEPHNVVLPVGVTRTDPAAGDYFGGAADGIRVSVDGERYVACVQPHMAADWSRTLDRSYTRSTQYRALYYATLATAGSTRIDCVATGLPVSLYFNKALREELVRQLRGRHEVAPGKEVDVAEARVYPQPAGTYIAYLSAAPGRQQVMEGRSALVIDPGFFSVDSVVIRNNRPYPNASATSTEAMSRVLERADGEITRLHDDATATPGLYKATLEERLREGRMDISSGSREIDARPYLECAAELSCERALREINSSLRGLEFNIDMVVVTGGGAWLYAPAIRKAFRRQRVVVMDHAPMANAIGFRVLAGGGHE